jgi:hypothetical protein
MFLQPAKTYSEYPDEDTMKNYLPYSSTLIEMIRRIAFLKAV